VDPLILSALEDPKNRTFVLRLERTILTLLRVPNEHSVELERMNSFYRLLAHKVADYYGVGHTSGTESSVLYYKLGMGSPLPATRLADIAMSGDVRRENQVKDGIMKPIVKLPVTGAVVDGDSDGMVAAKKVLVAKRPQLLTKDSGDKIRQVQPAPREDSPQDERIFDESLAPAQLRAGDKSLLVAAHGTTTGAPKGRGDYDARVAAYEEARARIFNSEDSEHSDDDDVTEGGGGDGVIEFLAQPLDDMSEYSRSTYAIAALSVGDRISGNGTGIRMNMSDTELYKGAPAAASSFKFSGQSFVPGRSTSSSRPS
jgi:hypothetical protein